MHIVEVRDDTLFHAMRPEWDGLIGRSETASIFQTWEWTSSYWRHFGNNQQLALLGVYDGQRLVGLAPLKIGSVHGLPFRRVRLIGSRASDYLDMIIDTEMREEALAAIFSWLKRNEHRWDVIDLEKMPENSFVLEHWPRIRRDFGWSNSLSEYGVCPCLALPASWEEMWAKMSKKQRSTLDYKARLMARNHVVRIGLLGESELEEGLRCLIRLHTRRWRKDGLPGNFTSERFQEFASEVTWLLSKRGWLRMYGLRLDGVLQSIQYCMAYGGKGFGYVGGWEPDLARYGLGSVLTAHAIRGAVEEGLREFDLLSGDEAYKSQWAQASHTTYRLIARKDGMRSRLAATASRAEQRIGARTKMVLARCLTASRVRHAGCILLADSYAPYLSQCMTSDSGFLAGLGF